MRAIEFYRDLYLAEEEGSDSYIVFHDAYTRFCVHNINWMARELRRKKLPSYIQELLKKNDKLYLEKIRRDLKELFNLDYGDLLTKSRESCGNISLDSDDEEPPNSSSGVTSTNLSLSLLIDRKEVEINVNSTKNDSSLWYIQGNLKTNFEDNRGIFCNCL